MFRVLQKQGLSLLVLFAVVAIALSGCSSGKSSPSAAGQFAGDSAGPTIPGGVPAGDGSGVGGASAAFGNMSNYKFSMTLAGGTWGSMLSALGGAGATGGGAFTVSGTVVVKPEKASDVQMSGFHIIEVGGFQYMDMGLGSYVKTKASGTSMADGFSPQKIFSGFAGSSSSSGYNKVGSENKNGVDADHFQASQTSLAQYGSMLGVPNATWTMDVWIAKNGGYPVSMAMLAKTSDNSVAYEVLFDITNVNDPANTVTAPTNVMGA